MGRISRNIVSFHGITEYAFEGGVITRGGGFFDIDMHLLAAQRVGQNEQYSVLCLLAPGLDNLPFDIVFDNPVWQFGSGGSCTERAIPKCSVWYEGDSEDYPHYNDNAAVIVKEPFFHPKGHISFPWDAAPRIKRIRFFVDQLEGNAPVNNGIFIVPKVVFDTVSS